MEAAAAESQNQRPFESYDPKSYDTCFMQNKNQQQCTLQHRLWKTNQFFHLPHNHNNNNQNFWNSNLIMQLLNSTQKALEIHNARNTKCRKLLRSTWAPKTAQIHVTETLEIRVFRNSSILSWEKKKKKDFCVFWIWDEKFRLNSANA